MSVLMDCGAPIALVLADVEVNFVSDTLSGWSAEVGNATEAVVVVLVEVMGAGFAVVCSGLPTVISLNGGEVVLVVSVVSEDSGCELNWSVVAASVCRISMRRCPVMRTTTLLLIVEVHWVIVLVTQ